MAAQSSIFSKSPSKDGFVDMKDYSAIEILQKSPPRTELCANGATSNSVIELSKRIEVINSLK